MSQIQMAAKSFTPQQRSVALVAGNVAACVVFLLLASRTWIEPELTDIPGASGGAGVVWLLTAAPVFALAALLNGAALLWAVWRRLKQAQWPFSALAWAVPLIWLATWLLDNSYHGA